MFETLICKGFTSDAEVQHHLVALLDTTPKMPGKGQIIDSLTSWPYNQITYKEAINYLNI